MAAKITVYNPYLNAICYHYFYNMPNETLKKLPIKYRRIMESQAKVKAWCEKSTMDEKAMFLYHIGLNFGITLFPDKIKSNVSLKEILKNYSEEKMAAAQDKQTNLGCYVSTDRHVAYLMGHICMTANHDSYLRSLDYNKTGFTLRDWSKQLDTPGQMEALSVGENAIYITKVLLNTGLNWEAVNQLFEVSSHQMLVLLYFYQRRQSYIHRSELYSYFDGYVTRARCLRATKRLILDGFLDKHLEWYKDQYRISTQGINKVNDFMNRILKATNFD